MPAIQQWARFSPGFRLSNFDIVVLVVGAAAAVALWLRVWWWGYIVAMVIAHFFLFCNVFRIARALELAWAAVFLGLAGNTAAGGWPGWPITTAGVLLTTVTVIVLEMQSPSYHGVGWEWINPQLSEWRQNQERKRRVG